MNRKIQKNLDNGRFNTRIRKNHKNYDVRKRVCTLIIYIY